MKTIALAVGLSVLLSACQNKPEDAAGQAGKPAGTLQKAMKTVIAPQAQILWDISNKGMNDEGGPDGSRLKEEDWAKIAAAGAMLEAKANELAETKAIVVAHPGEKLQDEENPGASNASQVQGFIDKDSQGFSDMARALAQSGADFADAGKQKDAVKLSNASNALDQVCESCHLRYWYPQQAAPQ